jgi:hypothetical protein
VVTVTVNDPVAVLPCASAAEHDTVVVLIANVLPDGGPHVTGRVPSTTSDADAVYETTAPDGLVAVALIGAGTVSAGGVRSVTVTVKLPVDGLPCASLAEQFTIVVATANGDPEAGVQLTATTPSTVSTAVAEKLTTVVAPVASVVMFAGSVSAGAV